jgi:hypothetical protein
MDGLITAVTVLWPALLIPVIACIRVQKSGINNAIFVLSGLSAASLAEVIGKAPVHVLEAINSWGDALMHAFGATDKD